VGGIVENIREPAQQKNRRGRRGLAAKSVNTDSSSKNWWSSATAWVVSIAAATVAVHLATGWRYGFDRDELMALEDARHLAWGYVQYPPMTAFFGWIALKLFGTSLVGFRFFAALAQAIAVALTGFMAREMGGGKWAQVVAALAAVPFCLGGGALMQYISFDYVCWVLVAWCVTKVAASAGSSPGQADVSRQHWWLGVGIAMGLGMLAKYTMGFFVCGVVAGILLTGMRRSLRSPWLWLGVLAAWLIFLPNLLWQWQRNFISLDFLKFLHVRDVGEGLTDWFLPGQLELTLLALPIALAGLWFFFFTESGKPFRILGWMYLVPLFLFLVLRGRPYYLAPAYPMLYTAGSVQLERFFGARRVASGEWRVAAALILALLADILIAGAIALPIAPVNSRWWKFASQVDTVFPEEIGWPEFVQSVAQVWNNLPAEDRSRAAILAGNYGEVGALNLYREQFHLPPAISGVNSSWERGYGDSPDVVIVVGYSRDFLQQEFDSCVEAAKVWNKYGIQNEEVVEDPEIFLCRGLKHTWPDFWARARRFA
jgi:Dolichyl-phosphate-mannose-protein mannosyltransferase